MFFKGKILKSIAIFLSLCTIILAANVWAQTSAGEALSRQVLSLKNMMESMSTGMSSRISTLETQLSTAQTDISDLQTVINRQTFCHNRSTTSLYWPNHPDADSNNCVTHTDIEGPTGGGTYTPPTCPSDQVWVGWRCACRCNTNLTPNSMENCAAVCRGSCFTAETKVLMADGSDLEIHKVKIGDKLMGRDGAINTVLDLDRPLLRKGKNQHLIEINGETAFTTDNHPLMTTDGWKALNPDMAEKEAYDQLSGNIGQLEIGQTLIMAQGKRQLIESIMIVPQEEEDRRLYNLMLDGDHTYYANGILVHGSIPDKKGKYPLSKEHNGEPQ
ncbi:MAG: Hint domain-containing protein [Pseudomonadota bacterium]|nr:Hint domain-containing protein [Pseudomonadota bacterium]